MRKILFPLGIVLAFAFWAAAVPEPRTGSGGSGTDANAITNAEPSFATKTGRQLFAPTLGTNTNTVSVGWQTRQAGETNMGNAALQVESPLRIMGSLVMPVTTNTVLTVNLATNAVQGYTTNADFAVTFTGTALNGARGEYRVWNTGDTNIILTWPASFSIQQAAGITSIPIRSNSLARIYWTVVGGSNFVEVANKDQYILNLTNVTAGQVFKFLDAHTVSNGADDNSGSNTALNDIGDSTADGVVAMAGNRQSYTSTLDGGVTTTITNSDADIAAATWLLEGAYRDNGDADAGFYKWTHNAGASIAESLTSTAWALNVPGTNSSTFLNLGAVGLGSTLSVAGASTFAATAATTTTNSSTMLVSGNTGLGGTLTVSGAITGPAAASFGAVSTPNVLVSSNITYTTANMVPSGNVTNFAGDFTFGWRTYLMTNSFHLTGMVNVAAADLGKAWIVKMRNYSGGALIASVDSGFRRSGTNYVSVGNGQNCDIIVTPDGTGGVNPTNLTAQITVYNSP